MKGYHIDQNKSLEHKCSTACMVCCLNKLLLSANDKISMNTHCRTMDRQTCEFKIFPIQLSNFELEMEIK